MHCLNCNKLIKRGHGVKSSKKYCSYECYKAKPPLVIKLENEFNQDIDTLIKDTEKMGCSEVLKAYSLGINRGTYRSYKLKYS